MSSFNMNTQYDGVRFQVGLVRLINLRGLYTMVNGLAFHSLSHNRIHGYNPNKIAEGGRYAF